MEQPVSSLLKTPYSIYKGLVQKYRARFPKEKLSMKKALQVLQFGSEIKPETQSQAYGILTRMTKLSL